ncbi:2-oxoglutarate dehydrogenase E1 component [Alicyclobacillus herbarius]|uniref:2-oxoglutarate dehydrogenase E1 component n=1 Tax=Alicyclobacillus herbarius TaxID=122960 RepID=UPI000419101F|nr:2-oxoglutarate dehydrogenase E1 component [Alicyclobacillus herbarius]
MANGTSADTHNPWREFLGPNLGYINELYERYREDPQSVDESVRRLFDEFGAPPSDEAGTVTGMVSGATATAGHDLEKVLAAAELVCNIRTYGHLAARIDPIDDSNRDTHYLEPSTYGLTDADLEKIPARLIWPQAPSDVRDGRAAIARLREIYTRSLAYEFEHVHVAEERIWLNQIVESGALKRPLTAEQKRALLERLSEVEGFERFLHRTFIGQKRFSIEGVDILVPMLDHLIRCAVEAGARDVMIGMAHRGRLNVLAHVLGKPYGVIFTEFHAAPNKELVPSEGSMGINYGWTGDVKYHLGMARSLTEGKEVQVRLTLANNPSHLEVVNPVVEGFTRAAQEDRTGGGAPKQDPKRAFAVLVHGDAAFPGEGVVAETLNLSRLAGYQTGGTIHIITNNKVGFTTESFDDRSTRYASDLAKGYEIPIVHVNADDPEACLAAISLACQYRSRFHRDFLIDLIGYRRWGHNEMDDPAVTQPLMYAKINAHKTVRALYADALIAEGVVRPEDVQNMEKSVGQRLQEEYQRVTAGEVDPPKSPLSDAGRPDRVQTAVAVERLRAINQALLTWPEGFTVYPKLARILKRREGSLEGDGRVDWPLAEALAFATILEDGTPVRITGQDTERGTFAQRHLVLHDPNTGRTWSPLQALPQAKATFAIHNSPLTETAVLGFEYGYNVFAPETLVLWEAQYGDFANVAQPMFDQFIAAGRAKWGQNSGLVMLLPHGYEGQGPEHSSARLERYLQLAAEDNWVVAYLTSAAQYFHLLRRQAARLGTPHMRPLVLMAPKSLLRNPRTASPWQEFCEGEFRPIVEQSGLGQNPDKVKRLILCTGKMAIDLETALESASEPLEHIHIVRVEQLYPYPQEAIEAVVSRFSNLEEVVWVQEEPKNMGAWNYMEPRIHASVADHIAVRYIGRRRRSSPAEGEPDVHNLEQARIVSEALQLNESKTAVK